MDDGLSPGLLSGLCALAIWSFRPFGSAGPVYIDIIASLSLIIIILLLLLPVNIRGEVPYVGQEFSWVDPELSLRPFFVLIFSSSGPKSSFPP